MAKLELTPEQQENTVIVGGSISPELAEGAARILGMDSGELERKQFANGEMYAHFGESVRGKDVFVIQPHAANKAQNLSVNDAIQEHLVMVDAAMRGSASSITAIAPFFGYARQDRKKNGREPVSAKLIANQFKAAGATALMAVDLHSPQVQGFFDPVFDNLTAMRALRHEVKGLIPKRQRSRWAMVAPDLGRATVAEKWAEDLGIDLVVVDKRRAKDGTVRAGTTNRFPEVEGRSCVVVDDMVDTAGTLVNGVEILSNSGAAEIAVAATHAPFSGPALERVESSAISKLIVTNSTPTAEAAAALGDRIAVLDISPILGSAIGRIVTKGSISRMFKGEDRS